MKQPTEAELKIIYWGLIDNPHYVYSRFVNLRPVAPPYSKILRPHRFYLRTRAGWRHRQDDMVISLLNAEWVEWPQYQTQYGWATFSNLFPWRFTDITTLVEKIDWNQYTFEYWMWISQDKNTIKIFKSEDWCYLNEVYSGCFCPCWIERFIPITFLKGFPKSMMVYKDWTTVVIPPNTNPFYTHCWIQTNYTFYQQNSSLSDYSFPWVDWTDVLWDLWQTQYSMQIGDYIYSYIIENFCEGWVGQRGICGQVNRITWINPEDKSKLMVKDYWLWFEPWQIDVNKIDKIKDYYSLYWTTQWVPDDYYVSWKEPQTQWHGAWAVVFPEIWETFAFQTCSWLTAFHHHDYNINGSEIIATPFCNYDGCYTDVVMYNGRNWVSHLVMLDNKNSVILYSDWWNIWYLWAGNTVSVRKNTLGMTTFQNYILYFWQEHIWAFYIDTQQDRLVWINRYVAIWNIIRNNLWCWINPDGRVEAYDEYENSFYFLWSNKRLYALSIVPSDTGVLTSQLQDMTEDDWAKWIIWDLENIDISDYVYIQADDDRFRIFINSSTTNNWKANKTKVLTYWKRYKFWTTDLSCCAVVSKEKKWVCWSYLIWDKIYDECGHFDCEAVPVEYMVEAHIWEDEVSRLEWNHSFNLKYLDYIKTQVGKRSTKLSGNSMLQILSYKDWLQFKKVIGWLYDTEYLDTIDKIHSWQEITVTQCMVDNLNDCETFFEECKWDTTIQNDFELINLPRDEASNLIRLCSWYDYRRCFNDCICKWEKKIDDYCFCYDDKKYHLSPFANIYSSIGMRWEMFTVQLRWTDDIWFWWFFIGIYNGNSPKDVRECNKLNCEWCNKDNKQYDTSDRCF